jgi:ADP-ribose pyrophosphatase
MSDGTRREAEQGTADDGFGEAERLSSRPVYAGRVIDLTIDRVRLPNGLERDLELVHFAGAAAVVPLLDTADGELVVLIRQYRYATGGWLLEIPAGKRDGDEDVETCARRELAEETGYRAATLEPLGWIWSTPGAVDERVWLFAARGLRDGDHDREADEVLELCRLPLAEAVRRAVDGEIQDAKTVCALLRLAARRRGAALAG